MLLAVLTSPPVLSQPLLQDHLRLSQVGAQPWAPDFASPATQQPLVSTPNNQPTSTELPAPLGPEYEPIGELTYEYVQYAAELCPSWCAEQLCQYAVQTPGHQVLTTSTCGPGTLTYACGPGSLQLAGHQAFSIGHSLSSSQQSLSNRALLTPSNSMGLLVRNSVSNSPSNSLSSSLS